MAETTADVRRDIELTRERMSSTLAQLEERLNVMEFVKDHPWPAIAIAAGAGFALSGSGADVKAAAATATAAHATGERASRLGPGLDDIVARLLGGVQLVLLERADELVNELRTAIGAKPPSGHGATQSAGGRDDGARSTLGASAPAYGAASGTTGGNGGTASFGTSGAATGGASGAAFGGESRDAGRDTIGTANDARTIRAD